jgi:hypothetical protein
MVKHLFWHTGNTERQFLLAVKGLLDEYQFCELTKIFVCRQLWMFVSNFTTVDHEKLRKLYKKTASKRRDDEDKDRSEVNGVYWTVICAHV